MSELEKALIEARLIEDVPKHGSNLLLAYIQQRVRAGVPLSKPVGDWLADCLERVADGENAKTVFAAKSRASGRPSGSGKHWDAAQIGDLIAFIESQIAAGEVANPSRGDSIRKAVAEVLGMSERHLQRILSTTRTN